MVADDKTGLRSARRLLARASGLAWGPFLLVAVAWAHAMVSTWRTWGNVYVDAGREWELARRISQGELLYRDVRHFYGPFSPYFNGALFRVFGVHLDVLVVAGLSSSVALAWGLYVISREFTGRWVSAAISTAFIYLCAFARLQGISIFNFVLPYSFSATYGMVAACWSLALLLLHLRTGRPALMWGAAAMLAVALLSKVELGVAALMPHGVLLVAQVRRPGTLRWVAWGAAGLVVVGVMALLAWAVGPALWTENLGGVVNQGSQHYMRNVMGLDAVGDAALAALRSLLLLGGVLLGAWLWGRALRKLRLPWLAKVLSIAAMVTAVVNLYLGENLRIPFRAMPVLALVALLAHAVRRVRGKGRPDEELGLMMVWALVLGSLLRIPLRVTPYHYGFFLLPPGIAGFGLVVAWYAPRLLRAHGWARHALVWTGMGALAGAALNVAWLTHNITKWKHEEITTARGTLRQPLAWGDSTALAWLAEYPPETTLLPVPQGAGYLFLSGLTPVDWMFAYLPMEVRGDEGDRAMLARLKAHPPDLVLWSSQDMRADFGFAGFGEDYARETATWLRANYVKVKERAGGQVLMARKPR